MNDLNHYQTLLRRRHLKLVHTERWNGDVIKLEPADSKSRYKHIYIDNRTFPPKAFATYKTIPVRAVHRHTKVRPKKVTNKGVLL